MLISASLDRDANYQSLQSYEGIRTVKSLTFDGTAIGDVGTDNIFTVTGVIALNIIGFCTTTLVGATATLELGIAGSTASLLAQTTATGITAGLLWVDTSPSAIETLPTAKVMNGGVAGTTVILTTATAAVTAGVLSLIALWRPLSNNGNLVAL